MRFPFNSNVMFDARMAVEPNRRNALRLPVQQPMPNGLDRDLRPPEIDMENKC